MRVLLTLFKHNIIIISNYNQVYKANTIIKCLFGSFKIIVWKVIKKHLISKLIASFFSLIAAEQPKKLISLIFCPRKFYHYDVTVLFQNTKFKLVVTIMFEGTTKIAIVSVLPFSTFIGYSHWYTVPYTV